MASASLEHFGKSFGMKKGAEKFPSMVVLSMTYVCNSKCPNCPYRTNPKIRKSYAGAMHIPDRLFRQIANEVGKHKAILRITGGGEPMLHPHSRELIEYACKRKCKVSLITNGSKLTLDDINAMVMDGVYAIEFSVDAGTAKEYAKVRRGLNWRRLEYTIAETKKIRDYAHSKMLIIVSVIAQRGVNIERATKHWQHFCDVVQVRKFLTWGYNDPAESADDSPYLPPKDRLPCPWLFERINIDTRGDITYCGEDISFAHKFANIHGNTIRKIWTGPEMTEARKLHMERRGDSMAMCATCPDWKFRSWKHNYWKMTENKA